MKFAGTITYIKNIILDYTSDFNISVFLRENKKGILIGVTIATIIFLFKEGNNLRGIFDKAKYGINKKEVIDRLNAIMEEKGVDFEKAQQILITEELLAGLRVTKPSWYLSDDRLIYQGQRVSFHDKEIGLVTGDFLGLIGPDVDGYDDIYVLRIIKDDSIRQAPISFVEEDTINVYK